MTKEEIHDEQIYPLIQKILEICKAHKISFIARLRLDAYILDNRPYGTAEHVELNKTELLARQPLLRRGMRLLRKE